jgi:WD40 repeat protein
MARVWDLASGQLLGTFSGHHDNVRALALAPDGSHVASTGDWSSGNWSVRIWDLSTTREERMLKELTHKRVSPAVFGVHSLVVTPVNPRLIAGGMGRLLIWDWDSGRLARDVGEFWKPEDFARSLALTRDGDLMVSAGGDNTVPVWDLKNVQVVCRLEGNTKKVRAAAVTPDGTRIVSAGEDSKVRVWSRGKQTRWNLASGLVEHTLVGHTGEVNKVAITPDGTRVVSGGKDGTVRVWDLATGSLEFTLAGQSNISNNEVTALAVTPDGSKIISGNKDGNVRVWSL